MNRFREKFKNVDFVPQNDPIWGKKRIFLKKGLR